MEGMHHAVDGPKSSHCCFFFWALVEGYGGIGPFLKEHHDELNPIPDTPCMAYMPISWGGFRGQCRRIWHTWSVWVYQHRRPTGHQLKPVRSLRALPNPPAIGDLAGKVLVQVQPDPGPNHPRVVLDPIPGGSCDPRDVSRRVASSLV